MSQDKAPYKNTKTHLKLVTYISCALALAVIFFFYGWLQIFVEGLCSAFFWLRSTWNTENDYEHGWLIPLFALYMLYHAWGSMKSIPQKPSLYGLLSIAFGALLYLLAVRTMQGRIAIAALPFMLCGLIWCYKGGRAAWHCLFPCFFLWLAIPLPGFQQATVGMQLLASQAAHTLAGWCGVQTILEGTNISSATGNWDAFDIAGGCSGMRSLMALIMISAAWGYLADRLSLWKRCVLALSAIPLSIIANAFRVASIFVCAEYINPVFASKTWHDWSGLLFFFPASLIGLALLHALLAGELPFCSRRRTVTRRHTADTRQHTADTPASVASPSVPSTPASVPSPPASELRQASTSPSEAATPGKQPANAIPRPSADSCPRTTLAALILPPILLTAMMSLVWFIPHEVKLRESAISPELPVGSSLPGWYGVRTQESEIERNVLAADTKFSKGIYQRINRITDQTEGAPITVSIVYSGNDMNSSIHRPERCLPAQGHRQLQASASVITLSNGMRLPCTRLDSTVVSEENGHETAYDYIHYYVFVGNDAICPSHYSRTLHDVYDRIVRGYTQRWAYFQVGTSCEHGDSTAAAKMDKNVRNLIGQLLPRLLNNSLLKP